MAPTLVCPPFHRDGWVYEEKVDGCRMLAYKDGSRVRLISRNGRDHTARFRELEGHTMVLPCRRLPDDGAKGWAIVEERGYEGLIAKDPRSTYRSGTLVDDAWCVILLRAATTTSAGWYTSLYSFSV